MILNWFKADDAVSFAQDAVREINRLFPPTEHKGKAIPKKEFQKKFGNLIIRTREFSLKHKLNLYQKAKLLNTIKWEMKEGGHEESIIDECIALLAPLLNR